MATRKGKTKVNLDNPMESIPPARVICSEHMETLADIAEEWHIAKGPGKGGTLPGQQRGARLSYQR